MFATSFVSALVLGLGSATAASAAAAPAIEGESVSHVTATGATLEAQIDPGAAPAGAYYQFQLVSNSSEFAAEILCPPEPTSGPFQPCVGTHASSALPIGHIPEASGTSPVSLDLADAGIVLQPGLIYHYRVLAAPAAQTEDTIEWEAPTVSGADQSFATPASPPSIEGESVSNITSTGATLEATIDPQGAANGVFYQFQLLLDPGETPTEIACPVSPPSGFSVCVGPQDPGALPLGFISGGEPQAVSLDLASAGVTLTPGRTYFFRVLVADRIFSEDAAEWEPPAVVGASEDFTTPIPPSIESEAASNVTTSNATLEAQINLHEAPAGVHYQFQLVTDPSEYASEILCPPTLQPGTDGCIGPQGSAALPIGFLPGNTLQPSATLGASLDLASAGVTLQPGRTYHYRVLVARRVQTEDTIEWEAPTVYGADQTFTTAPDPAPSSSQPSAAEGQSPAIQSPPAATPSHRGRHHRRKHRRQQHRANLHRGNRAG